MVIKISMSGEIHRLNMHPDSFSDLLKAVKDIYGAKVSSQFGLQYEDSEGDNVMLTNEDDYKAMLDSESDRNSIKIFILAGEGGSNEDKVDPEDDEDLKRLVELQAQENARLEAEKKAAGEAERERIEANQRALKEAMEAEERAKREAEEKAMKKALEAERAQREAIEAEEKAKKEAEEKARQEEIERARRKAEIQAEEQRKYEEQLAQRAAEQRAMLEKERKLKEEYELKMRKQKEEAEAKLREEAERKKMEEMRRQKEESEKKRLEEEARKRLEQRKLQAQEEIRNKSNSAVQGSLDETKSALREVLMKEFLPEITSIINGDKPIEQNIAPQKEIVEVPVGKVIEKEVPVEKIVYRTNPELEAVLQDMIKSYNALESYHKETIDFGLNNNIQKLMKIIGGAPQPEPVQKPVQEEVKGDNNAFVDEKKPVNPEPVNDPKKSKEYDCQFIREISSIPSKITSRDNVVYKTVAISNTGAQPWPKTSYLIPVNNAVKGQKAKLTNVQPGKEFSSVLILTNPGKSGVYESLWRVAYDEGDEQKYIGEAFMLKLAVDVNVNEGGNGGGAQQGGAKYTPEVVEKAKSLQSILSDQKLDNLLEFVAKKPKSSVEELLNDFLQ